MNRTIVADLGDERQYRELISQGTFQIFQVLLAFLVTNQISLRHKDSCSASLSHLTPFGFYFRKRNNLFIFRIQCSRCKATFSVLPHFLVRYRSQPASVFEKALIAYHGGLSFENVFRLFPEITPSNFYSFLCHIGSSSLLESLMKANLALPEKIQSDEKHSFCQGEKGYIPLITSGHVTYHIDYINSLEEKDLVKSYQKYMTEAQKIKENYTPKSVTLDGYQSTQNAMKKIFPLASLIYCWLHAVRSVFKRVKAFCEEVAKEISGSLWWVLKGKSEEKTVLKNSLSGWLRRYESFLPEDILLGLKGWLKRRRPSFYESIGQETEWSTSYQLDQICNHLDRKLFNMKYFHRKDSNKEDFLRGLALVHNLIPYQRRAKNAGKCPVEVEGGRLPHSNWFVSLLILTSGGYHKIP